MGLEDIISSNIHTINTRRTLKASQLNIFTVLSAFGTSTNSHNNPPPNQQELPVDYDSNITTPTTQITTNNNTIKMPAFSHLAAKAKAHHEGLNAAYATYYGAHSPSSSASNSAATSPRQSMESATSDATKVERSGSVSKAWKSVKKAAKDHHDGLNAAYATYYGQGASSAPTRANSAASVESVQHETQKKPSVWSKAAQRAKEHHASVNNAYATVYGSV
jgi:hypothetical protein